MEDSSVSSNGTDAGASLTGNNMNLDGFPAGVRFAPTDQELIGHLESWVLEKEGGGSTAHPLINHFIPTIEGDKDICYTHPENLPGVTRDGFSSYFFHRTSRAFPKGLRRKRKVPPSERGQRSTEDYVGDAHWHKTGKTCPVIVGGRQAGSKKLLVLQYVKQGKRVNSSWVMHQYHLGNGESMEVTENKDREMVLSKIFYRCPTATMIEQKDAEVTSETTPNILPVSGAAAVTADTVTMVQPQQSNRPTHRQRKSSAPVKLFLEAAVGDPISGDQGQVQGNNDHIATQLPVQSVHMEPDTDTTLPVQLGVGDSASGDQGQVHGNNQHIPSQHHVQAVDMEPDTTLALGLRLV